MRFRMVVTLGVALLVGVAQAQDADDDVDPNEWVIESYQFPSHELTGGYTSPNRGFLKCPQLPDPDAEDEAVQDFIRQSNSIVSHYFEIQGVTYPVGALFVFDPESTTLAARLPRRAHSTVLFAAESAQSDAPKYVPFDVTIFETSATKMRDVIEQARQTPEHRQLLDELVDLAEGDDDGVKILSTIRTEAKSGQRAMTDQVESVAIPFEMAIIGNGNVEFANDTLPVNTRFEIDPVIGPSGVEVQFYYKLNFNYAPAAKRVEEITTRGGETLSAAQNDAYNVELTNVMSVLSGGAKLLGTWKPEYGPNHEADILQAAFLEADIVPVLPLIDERVPQLLTNHGNAVLEIPDGPPQFEELEGDLPPGMIVRRFRIPPNAITDAYAGGGDGGGGAADPFAAIGPAEPRFSVAATAKDLLVASGIPFPEGSSANYMASTGELVVRNTPENIELVVVFLDRSDDLPRSVGITTHIVQGPAALIRSLARESRPLPDHAAAWADFSAAAEQGNASILRSTWMEVRSGQLMKVESGVMHQHSTEVVALLRSKEDDAEESHESMAMTRDVNRVGTKIESDPVIGADGRTIDLNLNVNYDYALPTREGKALIDPNGAIVLDGPATTFRKASVITSMTLQSGMTRMVGVWEPRGTEEFENADVLQAVFVRVDVLKYD
ncbi:MAG: hypothetical protein AAF585_12470 [Verrucomicrobiota bacterium]